MVTITEYVDNTEQGGPPDGVPVGHPSGRLWRGHAGMRDGYDYRWPTGGQIDYSLSAEPYRIVYTYPDAHAILTYCEHDLTLEVYPDAVAYRAAYASALAFYREHAL